MINDIHAATVHCDSMGETIYSILILDRFTQSS